MPWAEHDYVSPPPSPPTFHPEMGYLSPSLPTRRLLRVGLITGACGIALGVIAAMALVPGQQKPAQALRVEAAATVGQTDAKGQSDPNTTAAVASSPTAAGRRPCADPTSASKDRNCADASQKSASVRVLAPSPAGQLEGAPALPQGAPAAGELKLTEEPQSPAASQSPPEKTAHVRKKKRSRSRQEDPRSAYASPGGRYEPGPRGDARYDFSPRYESRFEPAARYESGPRAYNGPRYPQERWGNRGGWSW